MIGISLANSIGSVTPPITRPMGSILPSCVFDLDATRIPSYAGGDFLNMEGTPADAEVQTEYDYEGIASPVFTGTQGTSGAYFLMDGTAYLRGKNTLSAFLDSIHKTTGGSDFTCLMTIYYVSGNQVWFANRSSGTPFSSIGLYGYTLSATNKLALGQRGDTAAPQAVSVATLNTGQMNLIGISHKQSTNETRFWINSTTAEVISHTLNATTTTASASKLTLGAYGNGGLPIANTGRIKSAAMFNESLTDTQMIEVVKQLNTRHKASYV